MKYITQLSIVISVMLQLCPATAMAKTVGVVDMQKVLTSSDAGKKAKKELAERVKKYQDEINHKEEYLKKFKEELEKTGMLMSDIDRKKKEDDWRKNLKNFQDFVKAAQDDLDKLDKEYTDKLLVTIKNTIKQQLTARYYSICALIDGKPNCADDDLLAGLKITNFDNVTTEDISQLLIKLVNNDAGGVSGNYVSSTNAAKPPNANIKSDPPVITILSPTVGRSLKVVEKSAIVTIKGTAVSTNGISEVQVNGAEAIIDENGNFIAETRLKVGENVIAVSAVDTKNIRTEKTFTITREVTSKTAINKAVSADKHNNSVFGKYYALLIAVQDYASHEINKLDHPISDATKIKNILTKTYNFEDNGIIFLKNPDRKAIGKAFNDLRTKLTENDNLFIFYAGHGIWLEDMKQGYWLPRDASGANDPTDWIPNSTIRDNIRAIKAKHVLLVADACFSGGIFKVRDAFMRPNMSVEKTYEMPSRKAITSGSLKTVPDKSVFIEYLTKRLQDNKEKYLDSQKLFVSFKDAVINNSPVNQTPLYGAINEAGDEGGDFIFVRR